MSPLLLFALARWVVALGLLHAPRCSFHMFPALLDDSTAADVSQASGGSQLDCFLQISWFSWASGCSQNSLGNIYIASNDSSPCFFVFKERSVSARLGAADSVLRRTTATHSATARAPLAGAPVHALPRDACGHDEAAAPSQRAAGPPRSRGLSNMASRGLRPRVPPLGAYGNPTRCTGGGAFLMHSGNTPAHSCHELGERERKDLCAVVGVPCDRGVTAEEPVDEALAIGMSSVPVALRGCMLHGGASPHRQIPGQSQASGTFELPPEPEMRVSSWFDTTARTSVNRNFCIEHGYRRTQQLLLAAIEKRTHDNGGPP